MIKNLLTFAVLGGALTGLALAQAPAAAPAAAQSPTVKFSLDWILQGQQAPFLLGALELRTAHEQARASRPSGGGRLRDLAERPGREPWFELQPADLPCAACRTGPTS